MNAELYDKGIKTICAGNACREGQISHCILFDINKEACCTKPFYSGDIDPVPIVEQWLAERQPKPLPELPVKLKSGITYGDMVTRINAIIDYLTAREEKEE